MSIRETHSKKKKTLKNQRYYRSCKLNLAQSKRIIIQYKKKNPNPQALQCTCTWLGSKESHSAKAQVRFALASLAVLKGPELRLCRAVRASPCGGSKLPPCPASLGRSEGVGEGRDPGACCTDIGGLVQKSCSQASQLSP